MDVGSIPTSSTYLDKKERQMPATREIIMQQIREVKEKIQEAQNRNEDTTLLMEQYRELSRQFQETGKALLESKSILKG